MEEIWVCYFESILFLGVAYKRIYLHEEYIVVLELMGKFQNQIYKFKTNTLKILNIKIMPLIVFFVIWLSYKTLLLSFFFKVFDFN